MKAVIFGPPKTGKTTIFNALTGAEAPTDRFAPSHPPNLGSAPVADRRLEHLCEVHQPKKRTPALVDYVDLAGVADLSSLERKQQALLLPQLQQADLLVQVCRAFEDPALPQPEGTTVAAQMQDFLETLLLLDLEAVATLIARQAKGMARAAPVEEKQRFEALQRCQAHLEQSRPLRTLGLGPEEEKRLRGYAFLTLKRSWSSSTWARST